MMQEFYLFYKKYSNIFIVKFIFLISIKILKFFLKYIYYLKLKKNTNLFNLISQHSRNNYTIPWEDIYFNYNIMNNSIILQHDDKMIKFYDKSI